MPRAVACPRHDSVHRNLQMLLLLRLLLAQRFPDCPPPIETSCLIGQSQYTVAGVVLDDQGQVPAPDGPYAGLYNVTMSVSCVYTTFSNPPAVIFPPIGTPITVVGWGAQAQTTTGTAGLFFLYLADDAPTERIFGVFDVSNGGVPDTAANRQEIADTIVVENGDSSNVITLGTCDLPDPSPGVTPRSEAPSSDDDGGDDIGLPGSAAHLGIGLSMFLIAML